eukprot:TRINITY_DN41942_c0_g1_i1.p1 TRINITY_DN41942_c0_g1~~TRINITY_DN41942_c0_g1_i1.p1  ORF type:complete len:650 (+),score=191.55 TRINITY_DN41942_c0_g1_i1:69-1952(+)
MAWLFSRRREDASFVGRPLRLLFALALMQCWVPALADSPQTAAAAPALRSSSRGEPGRGNGGTVRASRQEMRPAPPVELEEEEKKFTDTDRACAVMLLGSISFMMGTFYATNHADQDFRFYAWSVLDTTISIFAAVLIFQACNGVVEHIVLEQLGLMSQLTLAFLSMLSWFCFLQLWLAGSVGVLQEWIDWFIVNREKHKKDKRKKNNKKHEPLLPEKRESEERDEPSEELEKHRMESKLAGWSTLLAHTTGFSAIHAWAIFQQQFKENLFGAFASVFMGFFFLWFVFKGIDKLRKTANKLSEDPTMLEQEEMLTEAAKEAEDDVLCLTASFLLVQVFRMIITGNLPNDEGEDESAEGRSQQAAISLLMVAVLQQVLQALRNLIHAKVGRLSEQMQIITSMTFAWCTYFAVKWILDAHMRQVEGMLKEVYQSLIVTILTMGLIWLLDWLADQSCTGDDIDKTLRILIESLGILVGFSWEKCFDTAVSSLSSASPNPAYVKLLLAIGLAAIVVPARNWYILPDLLLMKEAVEAAEEHAAQEQATGVAAESEKRKDPSLEMMRAESLKRRIMEAQADMNKLTKELDDHRKRADYHEDRGRVLTKLLDGFSNECMALKSLTDALQDEHRA